LRSALIPWESCRIDKMDPRIEVSVDKETVKNGPIFDGDEEITPDLEERVRNHYGPQATGTGAQSDAYGAYYDNETRTGDRTGVGTAGLGMTMNDRERGGEFREHASNDEGVGER
jgi:stress response protein YsnF